MASADRLAAWALALAVVAAGIATLPRYGLTCDEAYGNLFFGERYLHYFLTQDRAYLKFTQHELDVHAREPDLFRSTWRWAPRVFPPLFDIVSAAGMELLGHRLRWMDPFDAFHLPTIILAGVLLVAIHAFAAPRIGAAAAFAGAFLLGTYPRFWGDMHNNVKDVPEAALFALTVMALARWHEAPSLARAALAGLAGGAALAVKINAVFVPVILVLGLWPWQRSWRFWRGIPRHVANGLPHYGVQLVVAAAVFLGSWPWVQRRTVLRVGQYLSAFAIQGGRAAHAGWNSDPLLQTLATMPEAVLLLVATGLVVATRRVARGEDAGGAARLLLAWACVPILRASVPSAVNFDGIRHFLEFLPAAALLAGLGAVALVRLAPPGRARAAAAIGITAVVVANVGGALVRFHPYEMLYFNRLVGGLEGAARRHGFPEATDYWGSSYREGMAWLSAHVEPGGALYVPVFPHIVDLAAPLWLRRDLRVLDEDGLDEAMASGQTVHVMFVTREAMYDHVARALAPRPPVHQVVVDGHPIMVIHRVDARSGLGPPRPAVE
jgi:dolichyl-phosphate-mannose-protein mannosyltransferase